MTAWVLILTLMDTRGYVTQVESVATPFATWDACNAAGSEARTMPFILAPGPWKRWAMNRIDWVCVPTASPDSAMKPVDWTAIDRAIEETSASLRERCAEREAAKERLRDEMRRARAALKGTDHE